MKGLNSNSLSNITNKITKIFTKDVIEIGKNSKFNQRSDAKLSPVIFLKSLVTGFLVNTKASYEDLCQIIKENSNIEITKQGLYKKIQSENCLKFMSNSLNHFLKELKHNKTSLSNILSNFSNVNIIDSTNISLPESLNDIYPGYGGSVKKAGLKIQLIFDGLEQQINHLGITTTRQNDQGYNEHLKDIKKNSLYLQDLGYFNTTNLKKIHDSGAYFITKYFSATNIYDENQDKIDLCSILKKTKENNIIINAFLGQKNLIPVRMIIKRAPKEVASKRLNAIKKKAKKRIYKEERQCPKNKYLCNWTIYITNAPEEKLSNDEVFNIYPLRWQIELFFKLNKSLLSLDKIAGKTKNRVLCEIYTKLIIVILFLYIISPAIESSLQEISIFKSLKKFKNKAYKFLDALTSKYKFSKFLEDIIEDLSLFGLKDKPTEKYKTTMEYMHSTEKEVWIYV